MLTSNIICDFVGFRCHSDAFRIWYRNFTGNRGQNLRRRIGYFVPDGRRNTGGFEIQQETTPQTRCSPR